VSRGLALAADEEVEPIFKGVLGPALHELGDLRPLLGAFEVEDVLEESAVLLQRPRALLDGGIEEAVPVLTTLLGSAEDLVLVGVCLIEAFGDEFPVGLLIAGDGVSEEPGFELGPLVGDQFDLLEAEPPELALLPSRACDEGGDKLPVLAFLNKSRSTSCEWCEKACRSTCLHTTQTSSVMSSLFQLRLIFRFRNILSPVIGTY
jgi:hypothetical protein